MDDSSAAAERWLAIPGYEGRYEVSDLGRVRSVDRLHTCKSGEVRRYKGKLLKLTPAKDSGYVRVALGNGSDKPTVHTLVLRAFVGPPPEGMEGCHENDIKHDNRLVNLRWDTRLANILDKIRNGNDRHRNQTHCLRNHKLVSPNLVEAAAERGHRQCRACNRAVAYVDYYLNKHGIQLDLDSISDDYYERITNGTFKGGPRRRKSA